MILETTVEQSSLSSSAADHSQSSFSHNSDNKTLVKIKKKNKHNHIYHITMIKENHISPKFFLKVGQRELQFSVILYEQMPSIEKKGFEGEIH